MSEKLPEKKLTKTVGEPLTNIIQLFIKYYMNYLGKTNFHNSIMLLESLLHLHNYHYS